MGGSAIRAPTEFPDKPNIAARLVKLGQVSEAARALAATQAAEQLGGNTTSSNLSAGSNIASSYISSVPARDRLLDPHACLASPSPLERKSSLLGLIGFIVVVALTVVLTKVNFPLADIWSQRPVDRTYELASSAPPLAVRTEPTTSRLVVEPSQVVSGQPAPLGLALHGLAEDAAVIISGLLPGMSLSTGYAFGADAWRVPATDLPDAWIAPPENYVGAAYLVAELLLSDSKITDRQVIRVEWVPTISTAHYSNSVRKKSRLPEPTASQEHRRARCLLTHSRRSPTSRSRPSRRRTRAKLRAVRIAAAGRQSQLPGAATERIFGAARLYPKDANRRAAAGYAREGTPPRPGPLRHYSQAEDAIRWPEGTLMLGSRLFCVTTVSIICKIKAPVPVQAEDGLYRVPLIRTGAPIGAIRWT